MLGLAATWLLPGLLMLPPSTLAAGIGETIDEYLDHWVAFYPSQAFNEGLVSAAQRFETYSGEKISAWLALNHRVERALNPLPDGTSLEERVDAQVLLRRVRLELERWEHDRPLSHQPQWYTGQVAEALTRVLVSDKLSPTEKHRAVRNRLEGIRSLCRLGVEKLVTGSPSETISSFNSIEQSIVFYRDKLHSALVQSGIDQADGPLDGAIAETVRQMRRLADHIHEEIEPNATLPDTLGRENYRRKLAVYSDGSLVPESLATLALAEIGTVRAMMLELAAAWWNETNPGLESPRDTAILDAALAAMEEDRAQNRREFLEVFQAETRASIRFVAEKDLATLPKNLNVVVDQLPDHSPYATIGVVLPPGPFDPDASTLLYLPSIPDDAPKERREGFYRSFNNHFNRMIISHEIFPGHDMQFKIGLEHASRVRALFSNPYLSEGWASIAETVMLDAGWGGGDRLTRLAHLRKRLENATRAYLSVMVHAEGWGREQVIGFASTQGLLPPQFAANLWDRVSNPDRALQLTTYFAGSHGIRELWQREKERLGDDFVQKQFIDRVLRAGAVPISTLSEWVRSAP
jgi:hypothetical protein